jgi:glycogen debranching enzyme
MGGDIVLREGALVMVSDEMGDMPEGRRRLGLYYHDTRYLSILDMMINGQKPRLLISSSEQNYIAIIQMANPTLELTDGEVALARTISIHRNCTIKDALYEQISFYNHNRFDVPLKLTISFGGDFLDTFEVRGYERKKRGIIRIPEVAASKIILNYQGLDGIQRHTHVNFETAPSHVETEREYAHHLLARRTSSFLPESYEVAPRIMSHPPCAKATWDLVLKPRTPLDITFAIQAYEGENFNVMGSFDKSLGEVRKSYREWKQECTALQTDNEFFNRLIERSILDLRLLIEDTSEGPVPIAGIPWYACVFGRDSLVTSLQTLMLNPQIAVGTLRFLAKHQGTKVDPWHDEEPGKIVHEIRKGEMAKLNEIPHSAYYGSVDATPLFVMLFAETMKWLDDDELFREILPAAKFALEWMEKYGDLDGDGYIEYLSRSSGGIRNQGWKDSRGALTYPDGTPVEPPVALVEVQGYAYKAFTDMAELLQRKGELVLSRKLAERAVKLKENFNRDFWLADKQFFAQGLNASKKPIDLVTSNSGHCLFCGIVDDDKSQHLVRRLTSRDMSCGWGIRTVTSRTPRFNPMSYHQGSIWPQDNSFIVAGMRRHGYVKEAEEVASQIFEASMHFPYSRLPELFCGFARDKELCSMPVEYPVSCSPQAWATGSPILLLQSMLGMQADAASGKLYLSPKLPQWLQYVSVQNLRIGKGTVNLYFERQEEGTSFRITENSAGIEVVIS